MWNTESYHSKLKGAFTSFMAVFSLCFYTTMCVLVNSSWSLFSCFLPNGSCLRRTSLSRRRFLLVLKQYPVPAALIICTRMVLVDSQKFILTIVHQTYKLRCLANNGTEMFICRLLTWIWPLPLENGGEQSHELIFRFKMKSRRYGVNSRFVCSHWSPQCETLSDGFRRKPSWLRQWQH